MSIMIILLCILIAAILFVGAYHMAEYVVKKQHRVTILEDSYREATDHIATLEGDLKGLQQQIEQMQYEAQYNGERMNRPRAWNPSDPLNSSTSRQ